MATFKSLVDVYDDFLELPVDLAKGWVYRIEAASAELGLWCRALRMAAEAEDRSKAPDVPEGVESFEEWMLGADIYTRMVKDGVPVRMIAMCARAASLWHSGMDEEGVAAWWNAGGDPERMGSQNTRRELRAQKKTGATSTAAGNATRSRATTSGTKSPRPRKKATPARR